MDYRQELKYICSYGDIVILKNSLSAIMKVDENMLGEQSYNIRSIYFDDTFDTCMDENENGYDNRMKVRIRIYGKQKSPIKLELKYKENGYTKKRSANISLQLCEKLMNGKRIEYIDTNGDPVLNLLYLYMHNNHLTPKVIVEYDRTVFVNETGNVRITFDQNIRCSNRIEKIFEESIYPVSIMTAGKHILEVKYDELLPGYIADVINRGNLRQTAFSKYYLSRMAMRGEFYEY